VLAKQVDVSASGKRDVAAFAGGCFWGIELAFQRVPGVCSTEVGYCNGTKKNPTYEEVCSGLTGHAEAVKVVYDTSAIKFEDLLTVFWDLIDPTQLNQQGNDVGTQYRTGIYYQNEDQKVIALRSKDVIQKKYSHPVVTEVVLLSSWYRAEEYHQQYLAKGGQCSRTGDTTPIRCYG
jgi:methionine-S-sulfoxide reductase